MSPRWYDKRTGEYLALDTGGGPIARLWSTALAGLVDIGYIKATGQSVQIYAAENCGDARDANWSGRSHSGATRLSAIAPAPIFRRTRRRSAMYFVEQALQEVHAGRTQVLGPSSMCPTRRSGAAFTRPFAACSRIMSSFATAKSPIIIPTRQRLGTPARATVFGTPGPYEDAVQNTPIFEENGPDKFKGIDIMRTVRSFDPCLPCGVHMYTGGGRTIEVRHVPMFGVQNVGGS